MCYTYISNWEHAIAFFALKGSPFRRKCTKTSWHWSALWGFGLLCLFRCLHAEHFMPLLGSAQVT